MNQEKDVDGEVLKNSHREQGGRTQWHSFGK